MLGQGVVIVVDIGKTHARVSLWTRAGVCLGKVSRVNARLAAEPFQPLDTAETADWLLDVLGQFAGHRVEAIIPVTHGAALAAIRDGALAFAPLDYEWDIPAEALTEYRAQRDAFAQTGSPALPAGLNLGAQLHVLDGQGLLEGATLMPYAQYWAWLLSGVAVSEVTSLGCHTDLWDPGAGRFSPMAQRRGWAEQFAPLAGAGDAIGTLRADIARATGLSPDVRIHAGLHDSNAALLAARCFEAIGANEATVLSTGTWFVAMRSPAQPVGLAALPEARDCLVNVDVFGQPVPSARFMGGRELELLGERIAGPCLAGLDRVLDSGAMVLPGQVQGSGPFPHGPGGWIDRPAAAEERAACAGLYAALMADAALDLIGARERLLIEGRFAGSELFTRALASLRPDTQVYTAGSEADVSFGALSLVVPGLVPAGNLAPIAPLGARLAAYRARWREAIAARPGTAG